MKGRKVMRRHSQWGRCTGKKAPRSGSSIRNHEKAVLIDVDLDNPNDGFDDVIVIDAPEDVSGSRKSKGGKRSSYQGVISIDDDETDCEGNPAIRGKNVDMESYASSSKNDYVSDFMQSSRRVDEDQCFVVPKKTSASKMPKCKKAYSEKTSCGKRYGLSPDFESTSSDSSSDCEIMEGSGGNLGEQWERAFRRRKSGGSSSRKSGMEDLINVEANGTEQPTAEAPGCSSSSVDTNVQKQNPSAFQAVDHGITGDTQFNPGMKCPMRESDKEADNGTEFSNKKADVLSEKDVLAEEPSRFNEQKCYEHVSDGGSSFGCRKQSFEGSSSRSNIHINDIGNPFKCRDQNIERGCSDIPYSADIQSDPSAARLQKDVPSVSSVAQSDEDQLQQSCPAVPEDTPLHSIPETQKCGTSDCQGGDASPSGQRDIIIDREKLKETDDFKRAVEEEWACRQRELKIQAEEAQRLRKRKKAESMRLLDMEKRQKQRVEEMRETQKKVEANMSVKEQIRTVVRKELSKVELSCKDMASLLRGLGIQVDGGFCPSSDQVRAAYKRALLRFHPDRASTSDIRQQAEAEEKFKLISRMKEKLLPAT